MSWLDRLLGTWDFEMDHADMAQPITGRHRYERVLDGAWVQMACSYDHPDFPDAMALWSESEYHYFDVRGITRVFDVRSEDEGWSFVNVNEEFSQRSTTRFGGADVLTTTGERSYDAGATWEPDYTMRLRRVEAS